MILSSQQLAAFSAVARVGSFSKAAKELHVTQSALSQRVLNIEGENSTKNSSWARRLARVFGIDVLECDYCNERLMPVAAVTDPSQVKRYLRHVGIESEPPSRGYGFEQDCGLLLF